MQVDKVAAFNNSISAMFNSSTKPARDFKSVLGTTTKSFRDNHEEVNKSRDKFKNSNINKTMHKVTKAKNTKDAEQLKDEKASNENINESAEKKLSQISQLLNSDDIQTNTEKQDELLKLLIQLQGLIENKDFAPEQNIMNKISEVINSSVLDSLKQQDSLMKDVAGQIQMDSVSLNNELKQNNNPIIINESNKTDGNYVDEEKQGNSIGPNMEKANITDKKYENLIKAEDKAENNNVEKAEGKLTLREAAKEKLGVRQEYKIQHQNSNDSQINGEISTEGNEQNINAVYKNDSKIAFNYKANNNIKSVINSQAFNQADENINSASEKLKLVDSLKEKVNQTAESVEVKEKIITIKEAFKEFKQNQENSDNSQANLQANIKTDNQNIMIRNALNVKTSTVNYKDVLEQIKTGTKVVVSENTTEMTIKLNPENLGKLSLKLVTENGIVSAKFVAESQHVKEIIESNFNELKQSFMNQGLNIGNLSVSVGSEGDGLRQQLYNSFNGKKKNSTPVNNDNVIFDVNGYEEGTSEQGSSNNIYPESNVNYTV